MITASLIVAGIACVLFILQLTCNSCPVKPR